MAGFPELDLLGVAVGKDDGVLLGAQRESSSLTTYWSEHDLVDRPRAMGVEIAFRR